MHSLERWLRALPRRLVAIRRRPHVERDLDDEIRDHIERQTAANVAAGMPPDEARRAALVAFGGIERIKDESRDVRGLTLVDDLGQLRHALRSLLRARTYTVAVMATVALAVGAAGVVFTVLNDVLLRPLPYPESERLVGLWHSAPGLGISQMEQSAGTYLSYRQEAHSFESIGAYGRGMSTIAYADPGVTSERAPVSWVTASLLRTLEVHPLIGRLFADADEQGDTHLVAVLSEELWRTRFGADAGVVGRPIRIDGRTAQVVGVLPRSFAFPGSDIRLWVAFTIPKSPYLGSFNFRAIGRLRPGVSLEAAQRELQQILMRTPERYAEQRPGISTTTVLAQTGLAAVLHPMREDALGGIGRILWLVGAVVGVLTLVAFSNIASLTLARSEARQRELAIRAVLGASRLRVWWSIASESAIASLAGGAMGAVIGVAALAYLAHLGPTVVPDPMLKGDAQTLIPRLNEVRADLAFAVTIVVLIMAFYVMSASVASWRVLGVDARRLLRESGRGSTASRASQRMRSAFVAAEVALSLVLLSGSAVLGRSLLRLGAIQPGFDPAGVLTFWTSPPPWSYRSTADISRFYREALAAVERVPGVQSAGIVTKLPLSGWWAATPVFTEGGPGPEDALPSVVAHLGASSGYFRTMEIPLVAGRTFDENAVRRGAREAVVTRSFAARYWNDSSGQRALGKRIRQDAGAPWNTIVGVAGDVRDTALTAPPTSAVYLPEESGEERGPDSTIAYPRGTRDAAFVVRTRGSSPALSREIERAIRTLDPAVPVYDEAYMTERVARAGRRLRFVLLVLGAGAAATLALGIVGLYGVIAYMVGLRSREIGIRIALGLAPERAARMMFGRGVTIVAVGTAAGLLVFLAFARLLRSVTYGVGADDAASLAAAVMVVLAVSSLATWLPAARAARIDPVDALRRE